ncbi:MAG: hypothetical protein ACFFDT_09130 [Candidatus Hodarchaeota archaeon]
MSKWYEVLISGTINALILMLSRIGEELQFGFGRAFAFFGVAIIPTIFFQLKNTNFKIKKKGFFEGDEESMGFWIFALVLNTLLTLVVAIFVHPILWEILALFGYDAAKLW